MDKIKIGKSVNADSRTAIEKSRKSLLEDSIKHISEVQQTFNLVAYLMTKQGQNHDYTKLTEFEKFYNDYMDKAGEDFVNGEWYKIHISEEKHHNEHYLHKDITLINIFEEIIDKVVAGKGRAGRINLEYFNISDNILRLAFNNTIKLIDDLTEIDY